MVNSKYALRETTSNAKSLENRESSSSSHVSSPYFDFYTEKDPQYYQYESLTKMAKSRKKTSTPRRGKKPTRKINTASHPPLDLPYNNTNRVRHPEANDVLCGRGGNINNHPGNKVFRSYVAEQKNAYNLSTNKNQKAEISQSIVDMIHNLVPPGRFLIKEDSKYWMEVDENKALSKTSQALREGAPTIRAMASVKDVTRKTTKILGKRKHTNYKRSNSAANFEAVSGLEQNYHVTESPHPLIVPMSNGHRGKQLVFQLEATGINEEATTTQTEVLEENALPNPCVSFDEDTDTQDNRVGKLRKIITYANAETPPPPDTFPQTTTLPPLLTSGRSFDLDSSSGHNLPNFTHLRNVGNGTISPLLAPPASLTNSFTRAHSLTSSEVNGFNDGFRGDETFVNPFLNESTEDFYTREHSGDNTITNNTSNAASAAMGIESSDLGQINGSLKNSNDNCFLESVDTDFVPFPHDIDGTIYEEMRTIHDITHSDISPHLNDREDTLSPYLIQEEDIAFDTCKSFTSSSTKFDFHCQ